MTIRVGFFKKNFRWRQWGTHAWGGAISITPLGPKLYGKRLAGNCKPTYTKVLKDDIFVIKGSIRHLQIMLKFSSSTFGKPFLINIVFKIKNKIFLLKTKVI